MSSLEQLRLGSWSAIKLSYAGKLELINSVIFHYQVYWSNIFLLPNSVIHSIEALCRKYLWMGQKTNCLWNSWVQQTFLKGESIWNIKAREDDPSLFHDNWLCIGNLTKYMNADMKVWGENIKVCQWWHEERGWSIPTSFSRHYPHLATEISTKNLSENEDKRRWKENAAGIFSISGYYNLTRITLPKVNWYRLVWSGTAPNRYKFIAWLLVRQRLKT